MSDRIVVMNDGHVEQEGSAEEIFERPRTRFVANFMGAENIIDAAVVDADGASTRLRLGGSREITVPGPLPNGARGAAVVIRPEKVRLDTADGWRGQVKEHVYKGSVMSYMIGLEDGTVVNADVAHDDPAHRHNVGDEVTLAFRPEDLVVIPDQAKGA
jgi:spermidine/putrescine transport system ATP-binding protein